MSVRGVTVGKFCPFHKGHKYLIDQAKEQVDQLHVILGYRDDETIPAFDRVEWIRNTYLGSNVWVHPTLEDIPEAPEPWAERALSIVANPDVAFTSEAYGPPWAKAMGIEHRMIDVDRETYPISGTQIRNDLSGNYQWLADEAKAGLAINVVCMGAESTGTTTLSNELAEHYKTVWVPEYGRTWWESRRYLEDQTWGQRDFEQIISGQKGLAYNISKKANNVVVHDTNALATVAFEQRYRGVVTVYNSLQAMRAKPDLYIVTMSDIPWIQDGSRDSRMQRHTMQSDMLSLVGEANEESGVPYLAVFGSRANRMRAATTMIDQMIAERDGRIRGES